MAPGEQKAEIDEGDRVLAMHPGAEDSRTSLRRSGASGVVWQGMAYAAGKLVVAGTTVALAHLVAPNEFGLVALATVFITFADVVADGGVAQALVFLERNRRTTRSALLVSLCAGLGLASLVALTAPAIADFFRSPDVTNLVRALSVVLLLGSISSVPEALLRRSLKYRQLASASVLRAVVTGVVGVGLALTGLQAWALVLGTIAGAASYAVATWLMVPGQIDLKLWALGRNDLAAILRFGLPAAGGILLSRLIFDLDYLVVGRRIGSEALAYYSIAFRLPELAILNVFFVISSVTYPLYSRARDQPNRLRSGYLSSVRLQSVYGVAAGVGLAVVAPVAVPALLGHRWLPAIPALAALGVYAGLRSVGVGANDLYKAVGRPTISVWVSLIRLALLLPALLISSRFGILGIAWTQAALAGLFVLPMQGVAIRVIGVPVRQFLSSVAPAFIGGLAVLLAAWPVVHFLPASPLERLLVAMAAGGLALAGALRLAAPAVLNDVRTALGRRR